MTNDLVTSEMGQSGWTDENSGVCIHLMTKRWYGVAHVSYCSGGQPLALDTYSIAVQRGGVWHRANLSKEAHPVCLIWLSATAYSSSSSSSSTEHAASSIPTCVLLQ